MFVKDVGYSAGDRVVFPPYGVGVVSGISTQSVSNIPRRYYQVEFLSNSSKAYVPVDQPRMGGLRRVIDVKEVDEIEKRLQDDVSVLPGQWFARYQKVTEVLAKGDPFELASLTSELRNKLLRRGLPDLDLQSYRRAIKCLLQEIRELKDDRAKGVENILKQALLEIG